MPRTPSPQPVELYSLLLLSTNTTISAFPPLSFTPSTNWQPITSSPLTATITQNATSLFRANQSQHGTNVVVRIDLQHNTATDAWTSTSITRLPDLKSQTPVLVEMTVPGGNLGLMALLSELKMRERGVGVVRQVGGDVSGKNGEVVRMMELSV